MPGVSDFHKYVKKRLQTQKETYQRGKFLVCMIHLCLNDTPFKEIPKRPWLLHQDNNRYGKVGEENGTWSQIHTSLKLVKFWILEKESKYIYTYIVVNNWRKERLGRLAEPLSDKK